MKTAWFWYYPLAAIAPILAGIIAQTGIQPSVNSTECETEEFRRQQVQAALRYYELLQTAQIFDTTSCYRQPRLSSETTSESQQEGQWNDVSSP